MASHSHFPSDASQKVNSSNTASPVNNGLSNSLNQLSLDTGIVTPVSSRRSVSHSQTSTPTGKPSPRTLHRSPSSVSMYRNTQSPTPAMHRSPSSMSRSPSAMSVQSPALRTRTSLGSYGATPPRSRRGSPSPFGNPIPRSPLSALEDVPVYTARDIASSHFASELEMHSDVTGQRPTNTIVILHDSCYGHRFARPRTSKSALASIVERPERIQASVLGVSVAYVRLGGRHDEGRHPLHPKREASSLPSIPFRIRKTSRKLALSSSAVINVHGIKWMEELKVMCNGAEAKLASTGKELSRDITKNQDELPGKLHEGDLYLCSESLDAMEGALGAVCEGVDAVFQGSTVEGGPTRAFVVIRPPGHHCSSTYPSGFCWLNNVHVGIQHAIIKHGLTHAAIIDFDLHHGDGSQSIAWEHNQRAAAAKGKNTAAWKKTSIGYFSLHDINSYPCEMGDEEKVKNASLCIENAHGQNIWNVHLAQWKNEEEFWEIYETKYSVLLQKTRKFLQTQMQIRGSSTSATPKAAIFFSAGFDASEWESDGMQRHNVNVPTEFYARISRDVVKIALEEGLGVDGRIVSVLEGGYSDRALMTGVLSHISGLTEGDIVNKDEIVHPGLAQEMGRKLGALEGQSIANGVNVESKPYDKDWWSLPRLTQLDMVLNPSTVPEPHKPTRQSALGNFSSPTQSFIAKVVPHRRTSYGPSISTEVSPRQSVVRRVSSPKPPDVDWATAAHELSKLLIPSDRQVSSCKPEELSAAATRDRRERQSILNLSENSEDTVHTMGPPVKPSRMALRERKAPKSYVEDNDEPLGRPASKAGRRKTLAGAAVLAAPPVSSAHVLPPPELKHTLKQSSRRESLISNVSEAPSASTNGRSRLPSVHINGNVRPDTAQSMRPESSMSVRGTNGGARKTLATGPGRPRKSQASDGLSSIPHTDGARSIPTGRSSGSDTKLSNSDDAALDNITSGMGTMKLTLVTKAQREAKEKAKEQARDAKEDAKKQIKEAKEQVKEAKETSKVVTKVPRKPTLTRVAKPSLAKPKSKSEQNDVPQTTRPQASPIIKEELNTNPIDAPQPPPYSAILAHQPMQPTEALDAPLPTSSSPKETIRPVARTQGNSQNNGNVFIPYKPEGPVAVPAQQTDNLTWVPPNTNTPVGVKIMKRHEVPVFSPTGPIRFGVSSELGFVGVPSNVNGPSACLEQNLSSKKERQSAGTAQSGVERDDDIWEVPETPEK